MEGRNGNMKVSALRTAVLVLLCLQNSVYTLLRRYSQGVLKEKYSYAAVLLVGEVIKLVCSGFFSAFLWPSDSGSNVGAGTGVRKMIYLVKNSAKMLFLAVVYAAMNMLSFVAIKRIDAGAFTIVAQMKILTTAGFSVLFLGRRLSAQKWRSLVQLVLGVVLVSYGSYQAGHPSADCAELETAAVAPAADDGSADESSLSKMVVGYGAVLIEVTLSGCISIYFEKVLKSDDTLKLSVWDRNFQLAFHSIVLYVVVHGLGFGGEDEQDGFFAGWSMVTVLLAFLGAGGGILVALVMKHADSILKTLAVAGAIVVSTVLGFMLLDGPLTTQMVIGAAAVILAIFSYNDASAVAAPKVEVSQPKDVEAAEDKEPLIGNRSPTPKV